MYAQILATIALIVVYFGLFSLSKKIISRLGQKKNVPYQRIIYISKYFNGLFLVALTVLISVVWSVDYKGLAVFVSSIFAVIGIGLFAQWSILSNITSSVIIFFSFPAKIGSTIKIIDGDDSVCGEIVEITLFQVLLKNEQGEVVSYPNNLLLQQPVVIIPAKTNSETPGVE